MLSTFLIKKISRDHLTKTVCHPFNGRQKKNYRYVKNLLSGRKTVLIYSLIFKDFMKNKNKF